MQHHAGGVDDAVQSGRGLLFEAAAHGLFDPHVQGRSLLVHRARPHLAAHIRNAAAHLLDDIGAVVLLQEIGDLIQHLIYRRQASFIHEGEV